MILRREATAGWVLWIDTTSCRQAPLIAESKSSLQQHEVFEIRYDGDSDKENRKVRTYHHPYLVHELIGTILLLGCRSLLWTGNMCRRSCTPTGTSNSPSDPAGWECKRNGQAKKSWNMSHDFKSGVWKYFHLLSHWKNWVQDGWKTIKFEGQYKISPIHR